MSVPGPVRAPVPGPVPAPVPGAARILVVEDDRVIADAVVRRLRGHGHAVELLHDGPSAVAAVDAAVAAGTRYDVVVLDLGLPGLDGLEVCRRVQARVPMPVLMLTARGDEPDRLAGLAAGADDYLPKPFSPRELVARVDALLRRVERAAVLAGGAEPAQVVLGPLAVDAAARRVTVDGAEVPLTRTEFDLLWALARRPGQVVERATLLVEALRWPSAAAAALAPPTATRGVDSHVKALRRKLGPNHIRTVPGVGYALEPVGGDAW
jgi:DNA-binding response OmpR family regulator